ncbi:histone-like nucleoid-structuring protein Lsr2 [Streptomyces sp. NPDC050485]|uniref:Lsr2 dimerization domain-containing protein n=1 Tax=Streptomyces sp. NPDC050485 TaxID=3365617 RepID=UPI0037AB5A07
MAVIKRVVHDYTDDMTGLEIAESDVELKFTFSIDGARFQIDTHSETAKELRECVARAAANGSISYYVEKPPAPQVKKRTNPERSRLLKKIRYWANENGKQVASQGRIPEDIVTSYRTANPGVDMMPYDSE